jgi:hypothetical protein
LESGAAAVSRWGPLPSVTRPDKVLVRFNNKALLVAQSY